MFERKNMNSPDFSPLFGVHLSKCLQNNGCLDHILRSTRDRWVTAAPCGWNRESRHRWQMWTRNVLLIGGFQTFFVYVCFHPYLGKWSNLTSIFQRGWNHQLVVNTFGCFFRASSGDFKRSTRHSSSSTLALSDLGVDLITPWKFNISSQNQWLEDEISFWNGIFFDFQGRKVVYLIMHFPKKKWVGGFQK